MELSFLPEFPIRAPFGQNSYEIIEEISSGSFGNVYKINLKGNEQVYALKVLSKSKVSA